MHPAGAEQAVEKLENLGEIGGKRAAGPKGRIDSAAFTPGINPRRTSKTGFLGGISEMDI